MPYYFKPLCGKGVAINNPIFGYDKILTVIAEPKQMRNQPIFQTCNAAGKQPSTITYLKN